MLKKKPLKDLTMNWNAQRSPETRDEYDTNEDEKDGNGTRVTD